MKSRSRQDELSRRRRLNDGRCPTHGIALASKDVAFEYGAPVALVVGCPRADCDFQTKVVPGSKLDEALHD